MARPKAAVNAKQVLKLASAGWKITEMADFFGVDRDTIADGFSAELTKGKATLKGSLRQAQVTAAKRGNGTMLVWLGKQYLGQSDVSIDEYLLEAIKTAQLTKEDLLELIKKKDLIDLARPKKSFHEFCATAGYPAPFDKQVEMMKFGLYETVPRLLLGARGYGKTDYVPILGVAYQIYLDPEHETNLILTKSKERNGAMLREIQQACEKNGVSFDRANSNHLRARGLHGKDHSVSAVTIKTVTLRGRHPKRTIMDDPVTEDDVSEATRTHVERVYNEVMKLTQNVLIIGQPAHQYDLYAKLRDLVKKLEVPHGTIPELDHDIEAQRLAGVSEASISASYFLKVLTEGTSPFDKVKYVDRFPLGAGDSSIAFIDPSEGGDYTALTILRQYMQGVAVVGFVWKKAWNHCLDDMAPRLQKYGVKKLAFETNCTGDQPIEMLRALWPGIGIVGRRANDNKHSRIMAAGAFAHLIHLSKESDKLYLDHTVKYEYKSKFDDAPDSLASCLQWVGLIRGKE
jgi:hypothetical protein